MFIGSVSSVEDEAILGVGRAAGLQKFVDRVRLR
jgi:hypothetical protein